MSSLAFASHVVMQSDLHGLSNVLASDIDTDGDIDLLASSWSGEIAWFENLDGSFSSKKPIDTDARGSLVASDLDGDGDDDLVSAKAWYRNTDGQGNFSAPISINSEMENFWASLSFDVDADGDQDIIGTPRTPFGDARAISWLENINGAGIFHVREAIDSGLPGDVRSIQAVDLDGDNDRDLLVALSRKTAPMYYEQLVWYESDGLGSFGERNSIAMNSESSAVHLGDLDSDGDVDILSASASPDAGIGWYENTDGKGTFNEQQHILTTEPSLDRSISATDIDGDGDLDVLYSAANLVFGKIFWLENIDGKGAFSAPKLVDQEAGANSVLTTDIDGDGDQDLVAMASAKDEISWYENVDGGGDFQSRDSLTRAAAGVDSVSAADIDGDGDLDVLSASFLDGKVAWYPNVDGQGTFSIQLVINSESLVPGSRWVQAADMDQDGDVDVVASIGTNRDSWGENALVWYENEDGNGRFGGQHVISPGAPSMAHAVDIDGDGDLDVLSASNVAWHENRGGAREFSEPIPVKSSDDGEGAHWTNGIDLDGDGDTDVIAAFRDRIAWYENTDGNGTFGQRRYVGPRLDQLRAVHVTDVDGDGDLDVLSASSRDLGQNSILAWYENRDGQGRFGRQNVITTDQLKPETVFSADMDGDGDADVLSASSFFTSAGMIWYENIDGNGTFGPANSITTERYSIGLAADIDADGNMDALAAGYPDNKINWYEQLARQRTAGDANHDCRFDQLDIVQVLQAGKYFTGETSTFEEGDWNGDGVFDQLDLVVSLQTGEYLGR